MELKQETTTPVGNHKVVFKTLLTGAEREEVDNAPMKYAKTKDGQTFEFTDMTKIGTAQKHALLGVAVLSIDGDSTDVLGRLLKMYEPDYEHVHNQVVDAQKKMRGGETSTPF